MRNFGGRLVGEIFVLDYPNFCCIPNGQSENRVQPVQIIEHALYFNFLEREGLIP